MIKALLAVDCYGGMGYNGSLPWPHNKHDMKLFKDLTTNHVVVMGRRSWDDPKMPKPLPNRITYVASNRPVFYAGRISGNLVEEVKKLEETHSDKIIWVVGGPNVLTECRELYDSIHITHFKQRYRSDTRIMIDSFISGFKPAHAMVAPDFQSVHVRYDSIFSRK